MENFTLNSFLLQLEDLNLSEDALYPVFLCFLLFYLFIIIVNVGIILLIFTDRKLHQPMYLLFCNLSVNDIVGNSHTVLMTMAFDRYVAICNPLRYSVIMTNRMVVKLTVSAWGVAFVLVGILLGLTVRLNRCRTLIMNPYCDNASLFKLSCESVFINNVYGLTFTVVLFTASIGSMVLTYAKIIVVCLTSRNKSLNSKALKTCSTHLVLYLMMLISGFIVIILHRFPQFSFYRKLSAILFHIIPGSLNPVIYGVQSAEICRSMSRLFQFKTVNAFK
ncbi:olfactory receptor 52N5-like [Cynoglossus semilaevis]|uniref:olfactory receptor 52N5-like n=1 Tax=Cynoglossus semilaevis TaxID=244447 RepID=UPI0007DC87E3|nr:olfactory receptor 52N5-like [Cynoglossus semilaevis]